MSQKLVLNFTTDELKKLIDDKTSCVTLHKSVYNLQLYPYHLSDIGASIKELLNAKVAKYDKKLNGILLGYKNLKLLTPQGSIICDSCYIHIDIEGDFYIFKPEIDDLLTGVVNKKSNNHVGCLVHRLFNVSVPNTNEENWAGHDVSIGDEVILKIVFLDLEARLPYIRSELIETKTKIKKKKTIKGETEEHIEELQTQDETPIKKKKKRDKLKSELIENSVLEDSELDTSLKKKKKIKMKNTADGLITNNNVDESLAKIKMKINKLEKEMKLDEKKKRKSTEINKLNSKSNKETKKINGHSIEEETKSLQNSEIIKQIVNLDNTSIDKKKRKSKEHKPEKEATKIGSHTNLTIMADAEDRKTKKRKLSTSQNIVWENEGQLNLYDSDLEKTLGESPSTEVEKSFNLVKIEPLNPSNVLKRESNSSEDFKDKKEKKRKHKRDKQANDEEPKPKTMKKEPKVVKDAAIVKNKSKTKTNKS